MLTLFLQILDAWLGFEFASEWPIISPISAELFHRLFIMRITWLSVAVVFSVVFRQSKKQQELLHKQNWIQSLVGMYLPCSAKWNLYLGRQNLEGLLLLTNLKDNFLRFNPGFQGQVRMADRIKLLLGKNLGTKFFQAHSRGYEI